MTRRKLPEVTARGRAGPLDERLRNQRQGTALPLQTARSSGLICEEGSSVVILLGESCERGN
eukprot:2165841-Rhodomonas_salina.1